MRHKPGSCLLPFAVGVLGLDGDPTDDELRRRGRLDLALDAYVRRRGKRPPPTAGPPRTPRVCSRPSTTDGWYVLSDRASSSSPT